MTGWIGTSEAQLPVITVIGYDGSALGSAALQAISRATVVVGGQRQLDAVTLPEQAQAVVMGDVASAMAAVGMAVEAGVESVVLASGDPGFFGIVRRLHRERLAARVVVLPAVSSVAAAFGRVGLPWDDAVVVSAHGRPLRPALNVLRRFGTGIGPVAVLTDADSSPARIIEALGADCPRLVVLERLGEADQRITTVLPVEPETPSPDVLGPSGALARDWQAPNLVLTTGFGSRVPAPWLLGHRSRVVDSQPGWGLPDSAFVHRDGMITKREVRAAALARLAPAVGDLVWDLGAGSGSVAVECARLGAAAVAVESDPSACPHIEQNAAAHGVPVKVVCGRAPEALAALPEPDAVFIGGGGPTVVEAVAALRPPRVVVALATLERVAPTVAALVGYDVDTVLLQVSHLQPLGEGHRLVPANPVFLVSGVLA